MTSSQSLPLHAYAALRRARQTEREISNDDDGLFERTHRLASCTYDGAILAAVAAVDIQYQKIHTPAETAFQLTFAWVLNTVNTVSQLVMVWMLNVSVIERQESLFENDVMGMIARMQSHIDTMTSQGLSSNDPYEASILRRCIQADETLPFAHLLVVILWFSRMLQEVVESVQCMIIIWKLPDGKEVMEVSNVLDENYNIVDYKYYIVCLPRTLKVLVTIFVTGTRVFVAIVLSWTSAKYLILSNNMAHVLLKAVGLQFVVNLDELLFRSFAPGIFRRQIQHTAFKYQHPLVNLWQQWFGSMAKMVGVLLMGLTMNRIVFYKVWAFRAQCRDYFTMYPSDYTGTSQGTPFAEIFEFTKLPW